jgi:hypothetical protein
VAVHGCRRCDACTVAELCVQEQMNRTREASVLSLTEAGAAPRTKCMQMHQRQGAARGKASDFVCSSHATAKYMHED